MRLSGRLAAAIEILDDFEARRTPLKTAIADWSRVNRYAGAKDRAFISGLCLDALRKRNSLAEAMGAATGRALVLGALCFLWRTPVDEIAAAAEEEPHGPGALSADEAKALNTGPPAQYAADYPDWLHESIMRAFGENAVSMMAAFAERADVDLRVNTLKTEPAKAMAALKKVKAAPVSILTTSARIPAPDPSERAPAVTVIPAFNKGWVEVQDLGSQIAAAAAGRIEGAQVLDYCAGGGGKTLALAALMNNTGQLYAYDRDPRRLRPIYARAKRAGVRNLQILNPKTDKASLETLAGKMDVVFVDAPCTGAGTWRRHPDTKWRLTPQQLERRIAEQDQVLREAAAFVKPDGRLIYVTCSFLMEENEDRLAAFLDAHRDFAPSSLLEAIAASGLLTDEGRSALELCTTPDQALRLAPKTLRADGFFVAALQKAGET